MAKPNRKSNAKNREVVENVVNFEKAKSSSATVQNTGAIKRKRKAEVTIVPRNTAQEAYYVALENDENKVVIATGPAGTGKTLFGTLKAIQMLMAGEIERIIITRPAVSADEDLGFLPGDLNDKMAPWIRPIIDIFEEYFSPYEVKGMILDGVIEIAPIGMLRGRTFKNSVIVADETQNLHIKQALMLLTRIGDGSRMFLTGDIAQTDIKTENGLADLLKRLDHNKQNGIEVVKFEKCHVERSEIVKTILGLYGED